MSARRPRVVGLDISLTSTGMSDGQSVHAIQTSTGELLEARIDHQVRGIIGFVLSPTQWTDDFPQGRAAELVVIEAGAFSRGSQSEASEILSALRMMVRHRLWRLGIPFAMVSPTTLKLATCGDGRAVKQQMVAAVDERHGTDLASVKVKDGRRDMADAHALAAMGYHHVGHPLPIHPSAPSLNELAMLVVKWPDLWSDD